MAISYIGNVQNAGAANPLAGEFTVHASTAAGDLVVAQWYSRASAKTFTNTDAINILLDVNTANGGHLVVGWWIAGSNADSMTWDGGSVANGTTGWSTATYRGPNTSTPFRYSGSASGGSNQIPNMPSISTGSGDTLVGGFGGMDDYGTVTQPALFTTAGTWEQTLGTDASGGMSYDLDGGTGSAVDPAAYGTTFTAATYWYAWTGSLDPSAAPTPVAQTLTPTYDVRNVVAQTLGGAGGGTFGNAAAGGSANAIWANQKIVGKFTLTESGNVSKLTAYLSNIYTSHVACNVKAVIYSDNAGEPDALMATGSEVAIADNLSLQWVDLPITASLTSAAYHLGVIVDPNGAGLSFNKATSTGYFQMYNADTYSDGASDPFGAHTDQADRILSVYATYTTSGVSYDIRSLSAQTLTPVYDIQQSLTAVSQTLTPVYDLAQLVAQILTPVYDIQSSLTAVAQTLSPTYDVRNLAAQSLSPTYGMLNLAAQTLTPAYLIRELAAQSLTPVYDVRTGVAQTLSPAYSIVQFISQTLSPTYDVRALSAQELIPAYSIRQFVAQSLSPTYDVRAAVAQTLSPTYLIQQLAAQTLTPTYSVIQFVSQALTPTYDIQAIGLTAVAQTLTPVYSLRQFTSQTLTPAYAMRNLAASTLTPGYDVRQLTAGNLSPTYDVQQLVAATITPTYDVRELVAAVLTPAYDVRQMVGANLTPLYAILAIYGPDIAFVVTLMPSGWSARLLREGWSVETQVETWAARLRTNDWQADLQPSGWKAAVRRDES